jgi:hypothetical protein
LVALGGGGETTAVEQNTVDADGRRDVDVVVRVNAKDRLIGGVMLVGQWRVGHAGHGCSAADGSGTDGRRRAGKAEASGCVS